MAILAQLTVADWQSTIGLIGLPAVMIMAIGYASWKWGWYFMTEVAKPVANKLVEFFTKVETQIEKLVNSTERMCDQMDKQGERLDSHGNKLDEHGRTLDEIKQSLRK